MSPSETPRSLLQRLQKDPHNESSWRDFHALYDPWLRRWVARVTGSERPGADGDDIVQTVFLVVVRNLPKFEHNGRKGAFRRWLKTILTRAVRDHLAEAGRLTVSGEVMERLQELEDSRSTSSRQWDEEYTGYLRDRLRELVGQQFSGNDAEVFERMVLGNDEADEVADSQGRTKAAVLKAKSRMAHWLRENFAELLD
jgi:RNA polymerase sigma factor (sigma-70 family)